MPLGFKTFAKALGFSIAGTVAAAGGLEIVGASGDVVRPSMLRWPHSVGIGQFGWFNTYDHAALRRGFQVYRQVCAACHSLSGNLGVGENKQVAFRHFAGVTHTVEEVKEMAKEFDVVDEEPDDQGKPVIRKGKPTDYYPDTYGSEQEARAANDGAFPPPMFWMRHWKTDLLMGWAGEDYIFHLLTGYCDPPAGIEIEEGKHYNPYMAGGAIGMAPPLYNEIVQYEDGTPATMSQCAADVAQFLSYLSKPEHDQCMSMAYKAVPVFLVGIIASYIWKKQIFAGMKTTKASFHALKIKKGK